MWKFLEHSESEGKADPAFDRIPEQVISEQQVDVDTVSGATLTSEGIINAVKDALQEFSKESDVMDN